jgi:DNA-binding NtrC family response regulator
MARILIADDETDFRSVIAEALREAGHDVVECSDGDEAHERLQAGPFDVILSDLRMPGRSGLEVLKEASLRMPDAILIVLTAYGSMESAVDALRLGAHDFVIKPLNVEALLRKVSLLVKHQAALAENRFLRNSLALELPAAGMVGVSRAIEEVRRLVAKVAPTDSTVLITGETGSGKELVAQAVHGASLGKDAPFLAINCGCIPETLLESELFGHVRGAFTGADRDKKGLFEVAGEGTILLDEIGEMPLSLQAKLLRVLESREIMRVGSTSPLRIKARIVTATHRKLLEMTGIGTFRKDLYYRLAVFEIPIPPLRARRDDILPLAQHLLERLSRRMGKPVPALEPEALAALERYDWPGNVRELGNVLERALILCEGPRVGPAELPGMVATSAVHTDHPQDLKRARDAFEREHILSVLDQFKGDKQQAADALGINISSLYRKLQEVGEEASPLE